MQRMPRLSAKEIVDKFKETEQLHRAPKSKAEKRAEADAENGVEAFKEVRRTEDAARIRGNPLAAAIAAAGDAAAASARPTRSEQALLAAAEDTR